MSIADGRKIAIRFTQPLIGNITGLNPPVGYKKSAINLSKATVTSLNQYTYNNSYTREKAIDGNLSTCWWGTTAVNWICVQLPEAKVVTQLRLYLGSYYIKTFTLSASKDGENWVQLGGTYTAANSTTLKWYEFPLENGEAYVYYRVNTLTAQSSMIYLYELELCEDVPVGNETKFTVSFDQYNYVPGGALSRVTRPVTSIEVVDNRTILLNFNPGNLNSIQRAVGDITVAYDGSGTLMGQGGPVLAFERTFSPTYLDPKNNPHDIEHLEVLGMTGNIALSEIHYNYAYGYEHVELVGILASGKLTHVDDL